MDLAVVRGEDGKKQLYALALNPSDPVSDQRVSVMFEFDQILRFLQYCPRQYHLRRSTYTRRTGAAVTTSWSLCRECLSNKNGLKAVVSLLPLSDKFQSWSIGIKELNFFDQPEFEDWPLRVVNQKEVLRTLRLRTPVPPIEFVDGMPTRIMTPNIYVQSICDYLIHYRFEPLADQVKLVATENAQPRTRMRNLMRLSDGENFLHFVDNLPGKKVCFLTEPTRDIGYVTELGRLQTFVWVAPWAMRAFKKGTHRELDASFKGAYPYVYYTPQAIIANTGVACGLVLAPSERFGLYESYDACLSEEIFKPVLADLGRAIEKFCNNRGIERFACHRHLLEVIGSSTVAARLFSDLLEACTESELSSRMPQFTSDVAMFANNGLIAQDTLEKLEKYMGVTFTTDESGFYTGDINTTDVRARAFWALFARPGIARCSNHIEAFHRHVNAKVQGNFTFLHRLRILTEMVMKNRENANARITKKIEKRYKKLRDAAVERENAGEKIDHRVVCLCGQNQRNGGLFQVPGFCIHTAGVFKVTPNSDCFLCETDDCLERSMETCDAERIWPFKKPKDQGVIPKKSKCPYQWQPTAYRRLVQSVRHLLEVDIYEASEICFEYVSRNGCDYNQFCQWSTAEISKVKLSILEAFGGIQTK